MRALRVFALLMAVAVSVALAARFPQRRDRYVDDKKMHPQSTRTLRQSRSPVDEAEKGPDFWRLGAQRRLREARHTRPIELPAKNVIMFLGDGMSIPTMTAARIYQGQLHGQSGEESRLFFETFPYSGLSKTYCVNSQVADSACSATAYLCGVKGNYRTIGVTGAVAENDCKAMNDPENQVTSILRWAQEAGKGTGIVTTTRVTHASPAGTYAHVANRDWESDSDVSSDGLNATYCRDIAYQLIHGETGKNLKVIMGGGRREFLPTNKADEENVKGRRLDGEDLIDAWKKDKEARGASYAYAWNREGLLGASPDENDFFLGLFESSHMLYHLEAGAPPLNETEPTLSEMVSYAIKQLQGEEKGFVLFVEGGRIDHGHHNTQAHLALDEAVQMAEAVRTAAELTHVEDTLIVVTADHAHTMSISGYAARGSDIFGLAGKSSSDKKPYSILSYANGPGYHSEEDGRYDLTSDDMNAPAYEFPALAPLSSETHGGDDVAVLSRGPWAHLLTGVFEQNYIPHLMAYAACVGSGDTSCDVDVF